MKPPPPLPDAERRRLPHSSKMNLMFLSFSHGIFSTYLSHASNASPMRLASLRALNCKRIVDIHKELLLGVECQVGIGVGVLGEIIDVVGALFQQPAVPVIDTAELIGQRFSNGRLPYAREEIVFLLRASRRISRRCLPRTRSP